MGRRREHENGTARVRAWREKQKQQYLEQIPQVHGEGYTFYQGDAVTLVPLLRGYDHCITDPPYEEKAHGGTRRTRAVLEGRTPYAAIDFAPITPGQRRLFGTVPCAWMIIFCQAEAVGLYQAVLGAKYRAPLFWVKRDGAPNFQGDRPGMGYETMACAWGRPGQADWNRGGKRNLYFHSPRHDPAWPHPTQKPVALMRELIRDFTQPYETILDPFMGSASTGVACLLEGRSFIGIELDATYFAMACDRLAATTWQEPLLIGPGRKERSDWLPKETIAELRRESRDRRRQRDVFPLEPGHCRPLIPEPVTKGNKKHGEDWSSVCPPP
jgi:site-specific DNA-methyltransferase (adenine-specific)